MLLFLLGANVTNFKNGEDILWNIIKEYGINRCEP
jgi:hypothetical protein